MPSVYRVLFILFIILHVCTLYSQYDIILLGGVVMETRLNVRIEKELKDKADKFAKSKGMNLSVLVRNLLIKEMEVK